MEPSQQLQMASQGPEGEGAQSATATPLTAPRVKPSTMPPLSDAFAQEINSYLKLGYTNKMLEDATKLDRIHLRKLRRNFVTTGNVIVHKEPPGRPKKLQPEHEKALLRFLHRKPNTYHEEMAQFLTDAFEVKVHQSTISRTLKKYGIVRYHQKAPLPGEEGPGKLLRGPGPRPSMLLEVRSVDPVLQYISPGCGPRPSEILRPSGNPRPAGNPHSPETSRPPNIPQVQEDTPPSENPRAVDYPRSSDDSHESMDQHASAMLQLLRNQRTSESPQSSSHPTQENAALGIISTSTSVTPPTTAQHQGNKDRGT